MTNSEHESRLALAKTISQKAGRLTLKYFRTDDFEVNRKQDGSPLTIADQEAEKLLRAEIHKAFPHDAIVGEEFGETPGSSGFCWVLDPIDGTKSFISGVPLYGTMVGVDTEDSTGQGPRQSLIGAVYFPALNEGIYAMNGNGAWYFQGDDPPIPARVSQTSQLADSVFVTSEVETFAERGASPAYQQLVKQVYFARSWGDVYGYLLVATGRVEVMIDPILNLWDAAAVEPIITEAGGKFTDWAGNTNIEAGEAVGSNGLVHDAVLKILAAGK
jgi:histidinol-phosphatase